VEPGVTVGDPVELEGRTVPGMVEGAVVVPGGGVVPGVGAPVAPGGCVVPGVTVGDPVELEGRTVPGMVEGAVVVPGGGVVPGVGAAVAPGEGAAVAPGGGVVPGVGAAVAPGDGAVVIPGVGAVVVPGMGAVVVPPGVGMAVVPPGIGASVDTTGVATGAVVATGGAVTEGATVSNMLGASDGSKLGQYFLLFFFLDFAPPFPFFEDMVIIIIPPFPLGGMQSPGSFLDLPFLLLYRGVGAKEMVGVYVAAASSSSSSSKEEPFPFPIMRPPFPIRPWPLGATEMEGAIDWADPPIRPFLASVATVVHAEPLYSLTTTASSSWKNILLLVLRYSGSHRRRRAGAAVARGVGTAVVELEGRTVPGTMEGGVEGVGAVVELEGRTVPGMVEGGVEDPGVGVKGVGAAVVEPLDGRTVPGTVEGGVEDGLAASVGRVTTANPIGPLDWCFFVIIIILPWDSFFGPSVTSANAPITIWPLGAVLARMDGTELSPRMPVRTVVQASPLYSWTTPKESS
jgi:hypothetical protein